MKEKNFNWKKYFFETMSMFIAVISAFALNNWSQNNRDRTAEKEILIEMESAVKTDLRTLKFNKSQYIIANEACDYLKDIIDNKPVSQDSIQYYYNAIFDDYVFNSDKTGYDGLVAKGLDIVKDKELRGEITYLYNYYFDLVVKLEEQPQSQAIRYYFPINNILMKDMQFNDGGELIKIKQPLSISKIDKKKLYSYIWQLKHIKSIKIDIYHSLAEGLIMVEKEVSKTIKDFD